MRSRYRVCRGRLPETLLIIRLSMNTTLVSYCGLITRHLAHEHSAKTSKQKLPEGSLLISVHSLDLPRNGPSTMLLHLWPVDPRTSCLLPCPLRMV
eukprot:977211-Pelagomonas_calceolata.AAC.1